MTEPESRFYESARLRLHYLVYGDESLPPLVLVHGTRDHARSWDFVAEHMTDRFCVYAPDLRGHGDSDWAVGSAYSVAAYVADLAKMMDVIDRGPVSLVGHSLGGRVTLDYAAAAPECVSRLIAIEGYGRQGSSDHPVERLRAYVKLVRDLEQRGPHLYATLAEAEERMQEANKRLTPEMVRHLTLHAVKHVEGAQTGGRQGYVWKFDNYIRLTPAPEWTPADTALLWKQIEAPTLHIGGSDSWGKRFSDGREELASAVPNSKTVIVDGAGHWVHHDNLPEFVRLLREFFAS
jgi:pimeloyl-ACP methyl ester carboxylesterase